MGKVGPRGWIPNQDDLEKIEQFAARGLNKEQCAYGMGVHPATWYDKEKTYPEIIEAYKRGKTKGIAAVSNKLFEMCMEKNLGAICFYLKCQGMWRENNPENQTIIPIVVNVEGKKYELNAG